MSISGVSQNYVAPPSSSGTSGDASSASASASSSSSSSAQWVSKTQVLAALSAIIEQAQAAGEATADASGHLSSNNQFVQQAINLTNQVRGSELPMSAAQQAAWI